MPLRLAFRRLSRWTSVRLVAAKHQGPFAQGRGKGRGLAEEKKRRESPGPSSLSSSRVCNRKTFGPSEDHKTIPGVRVAPGIPQRPRDLPTSHQYPTGLLDLCSASALTPALCAVCGGVSTGLVGPRANPSVFIHAPNS